MIERLRCLRDGYSDEIPEEILHGQGRFKVRRNWWHGLIGYLERGLEYGDIPKEFGEEIEAFVERYTSEEFHRQPLTTSDDISRANSLLDKILDGTE